MIVINNLVPINDEVIVSEILNQEAKVAKDAVFLSSIPSDNHYVHNSKVANKIIDIFSNGTDGAIVSTGGKKEIEVACQLFYDEEKITIAGKKPLTPFDKAVNNSISTLYEAGNQILTPAMVWREMAGLTDQETPSKKQIASITESMDKMRFMRLILDYTEEAKARKINADSTTYDTYLFSASAVTVTTGGQKVKAYKLLEKPALYDYSQRLKQVLSFPRELLAIKEDNVPFPLTEKRIIMRDYLLQRIGVMKGSTGSKQSNRILFENIYELITDGKEMLRKDKLRVRKDAEIIFQYWVEKRLITGFSFVKKGQTIYAIDIKI